MKMKLKKKDKRKAEAVPEPVAAKVCTGTTIKGTACTQSPKPGTDRCVFHPRKPGEKRP